MLFRSQHNPLYTLKKNGSIKNRVLSEKKVINVSRTEKNRKLSNLPWAEGLRASRCSEPTSHHPPVAAAAEAEATVAAKKKANNKRIQYQVLGSGAPKERVVTLWIKIELN